jgi:pyruvate formate lyase activating enzyme
MAIKRGVIFDVKKFAIDDGPGIRTTIFFKGCLLHCWWCHNPEGQLPTPELMYRRTRCDSCAECVRICPEKAIAYSHKRISIDRDHCSLCGKCCQECPTGALALAGKQMRLRDVLREIDKDSIFYDESEGGVTASGGEPLLQLDFLNALLKECRDRNIRTAVDTCGYASPGAIDKISDKVDLFLFDIKTMNEKKHIKYTGVSNRPILENLKRLAANGSNIQVRFPIIPGINDDKENVTETAEFVASCRIKNISLLPYHRAGTEKYKSLNRTYKLKRTQTPSHQDLNLIEEELEALGLKVRIGGG